MDKINDLIKSEHTYIDNNGEEQYYLEVTDEHFINEYNNNPEWKNCEYITKQYNYMKLKLNI